MTVKSITRAAIIAALYVAISFAIQPFASGLMQCRLSEALSVLLYFTVSAVPGLFLGCLLFNLLTGAVVYDVVFGSLATLLAALCTWYLQKRGASRYLAPLPSVVLNGLIVGAVLVYAYGVPATYPVAALAVAAGQAIACYGVGLPLLIVLERYRDRLF